jgi:hypothetical protein
MERIFSTLSRTSAHALKNLEPILMAYTQYHR